MRELFSRICADFEAERIEFDGEDDHVHLLAHYPPKVALSALVNSLKGVSSRILRKRSQGWQGDIARASSGRPATSPPPAVALRSTLSSAISKAKERQVSTLAPYIPSLKAEAIRHLA